MKSLFALLFAGCLLVVPPCRAQIQLSSLQLEEALRRGSEAIAAGQFDEARKWFQEAVQASPENPAAHMELGVAELRLGKPEEASKELRAAIQRDARMLGANLFLGIAYAQMHRLDEAIAALQREIELDAKNSQALMWLGIVELQAGHPEKATAPLDRAAELSPDDLNILDYRGKAHNDVAFYSYARMATLAPHSWHVHKVQGEFYVHQKLHKEAIAEFLEAIRLAPNNSDLYEELGDEYRKGSSLDLAQKAYAKELELSPNNLIAMYNLAQIDIEINDAEEGLQLMRKVVADYANAPAAYFYMGLGLFETGKYPEAAASLEQARGMKPEANLAPRIEYELSRVYRKLGRTADSERAIREFARLKAAAAAQNPSALPAVQSNPAQGETPAPEPHSKN